MRNIIAKQFTPIYDPKEDRIRLIINLNYPDRYDIWITRKFLIDILDNLQNFFFQHNIEFNYNTPNNVSTDTKESLPIYENKNEPQILENFSLTKDDDRFVLVLKDSTTTIQSILGQEEIKQFILYTINSVNIQWGIGAFL